MSVWHVQRGAGREGGDNCAEEDGGEYEGVPRPPHVSLTVNSSFTFSRAFYVLSFFSEVIATLVFLLAIILHFTWWAWWCAARASMTIIKVSLLACFFYYLEILPPCAMKLFENRFSTYESRSHSRLVRGARVCPPVIRS